MTDPTPMTDEDLAALDESVNTWPHGVVEVVEAGNHILGYDILPVDPESDSEIEPGRRAMFGRKSEADHVAACLNAAPLLIAEVRRLRKIEAEHQAATDAMDEWAPLSQDDVMPLSQRISNEAADFEMMADHISRTYYHFTNGQVSKPNTLPEVVFSLADDCQRESDNQDLKDLRAELSEVKAGYDALDSNWSTVHDAFSGAIREVCEMPEATVPELCDQIQSWRQQALATRIPESGAN